MGHSIRNDKIAQGGERGERVIKDTSKIIPC